MYWKEKPIWKGFIPRAKSVEATFVPMAIYKGPSKTLNGFYDMIYMYSLTCVKDHKSCE